MRRIVPSPAERRPASNLDRDRPGRAIRGGRLEASRDYSAARDPIASFDFDEDDGSPLLWGCAALLGAAALVRSAAGVRADFDFTGWPSFMRSKDDDVAIGGAEFSLGEQACQSLLGLGLMPVVNLRGSTTVRLLRLQSLAG